MDGSGQTQTLALYLGGKSDQYPVNRKLGTSNTLGGLFKEEKNFFV
jgi:hypothetical protein